MRLAGRPAAVRVAVGRRARAGVTRRLADADRRTAPPASTRTRWLLSSDGKRLFVACGNSARGLGVRHVFRRRDRADLDEPVPGRAADVDAELAGAVARRPDAARRQRRQQRRRRRRHQQRRRAASSTASSRPAGIRPGAIFSRDGKQMFVLSGKGLASAPNMASDGAWNSGCMGAVSVVPMPDRTTLAEYTRKVLRADAVQRRHAADDRRTSRSARRFRATVGGSSPIKHVFYIIRENRTYDQILGDLPQGNGDPALTLFGRDITPNAHALAQNFVALRQFLRRRRRQLRRSRVFDRGVRDRRHPEDVADVLRRTAAACISARAAASCATRSATSRAPQRRLHLGLRAARQRQRPQLRRVRRAHIAKSPAGDVVAIESVPGLTGTPSRPASPASISTSPTTSASTPGCTEFRQLRKQRQPAAALDHAPAATITRAGTTPGAPTPRAMIADNDLALGRVVEAISNSVYWKDSAIFVVEDDAQSGPDHVDSHRSVAARRESVREARRRRPHVLHDVRRAADHRADSRPAADEPVRRRGDAAATTPSWARRTSRPTGALTRACRLDERTCRGLRRGAVRSRWIFRTRIATPEGSAQRNHLAVGQGRDIRRCRRRAGASSSARRRRARATTTTTNARA